MYHARIAIVCFLVAGWTALTGMSSAEEAVSVVKLVRESEEETAAGNHESAQALARSATEMDPAWGPGWRQYGIALLRGDQTEASIPAFQQAVGLDTEDANAWRGLSLALWRTDQANEAVHALSTYLRLRPQDRVAWRDIATWLIHMDRLEQAVLALVKVVEMKEDDHSAWRDLSVLHQRLERFDEAEVSLRKVLELNADDVAAWRELSSVHQRTDRIGQAIAAMEKALELDGEDASSWSALGALHLAQGQREEAVAALEQSLALRPDDAAVLRDLGWGLWAMDRRAEAVERLEKAVRLDVEERERVVRQVAARLSEEGAAEEAMAFVRRVDPEVPLAVVAIDLVKRGRLLAAGPLLAASWQQEGQAPLTGLYLAYVRAIEGQVTDVDLYLGPFIDQAADADDEHLVMALETLKLCGENPATSGLVTRLEEQIGDRAPFRTGLTDVLEKSADAMRARGMPDQALVLYRRVLERDPDRMSWTWAYRLSQELETQGETDALLADIAVRCTLPVVRAGVEGVRADRAGAPAEAVERLEASVALEPDQPFLRIILFNNYLQLWQLSDAYAQADWFQDRVDEGQSSLRSFLAESWVRLGETERALEQWQLLYLSFPEQLYYGMETASALYRLGRPEEALEVLREMTQVMDDHRIFELGAEIATALDRPGEAVEWAAAGKEDAPRPALLRVHAENSERLGDYPAALESALAYLEQDPGYTPMALLAGRALVALERREEARGHYKNLLERNPVLLPALTALRDDAITEGRFGDAVAVSRTRIALQPGNPDALRQQAHAMAQDDQFRPALQSLRSAARRPVADAVPVLVYRRVTDQEYPGRNSVGQIARHIAVLAEHGYHFITGGDQYTAHAGARRVMLILLDPDARVVEALDPVLQQRDARVLYTGTGTVPNHAVEGMPFPDRLGPVLRSGRWRRASSGPEGANRLPINEAGIAGHPFVQPVWVDGQVEDEDAFADRVNRAMADAARPIADEPVRLLVYPSGDFGQHALDVRAAPRWAERATGPSVAAALSGLDRFRSVVAEYFTHAVYFDTGGFWLADTDPLRIPARVVPPQWDDAALLQYLTQDNPLVRARLERARILYWHGQYEAAIRGFADAAEVGADPLDVTFNRGMASHMQGDTPTALARLRDALEMDPESERVASALARTEDRLRPRLHLLLRGWEDNEDRSLQQYGVTGRLHVGDRLHLGPILDFNRWRTEGLGSEEGIRTGAHAQVFLVPQIWITGRAWHLELDEGDSRWGGRVALRVPNPVLSGYLEASATREEIDTLEAVRAEIDARILALHLYNRFFNDIDLFADLSRNERTDGNDTDMLEGRLLYRVNHWPYVGLGMRVRFADSDFRTDEYWSPDRLEQYQLHGSLRRSWNGTSGALSGSAGYARERSTDWRFVWGARGEVDVTLNEWLELNASLGWFEGPVYERLTWSGGLTGKF